MNYFRKIMIIFLVAFIFVAPTYSSTIATYLEVVLSDSGELVQGKHDITLSLLDNSNGVLWTETHQDILINNGVVSFQFGTINELKTHYFYESDIRLTLTINNETVDLPMYSIPFSFFAHAADIVNSVQMNGVFHSDLVNERIGISIEHTTPSVKLEIGGAMKLASVNTIETGVIRWNPDTMRLEGRHNANWKLLDVSEDDKFDSKWTESTTIQAFYVYDQSVYMGGFGTNEALFVSGNVYGTGYLILDDTLTVTGQVLIGTEFRVSSDANITVKDVYIDASNYFDFTDGLVMSGTIYGDGAGLTNIDRDSIMPSSIQNIEISSLAFSTDKFTDNSITNEKIQLEVIDRTLLSDSFILGSEFFMPLIVSDNLIERKTITMEDLAADFDLTTYLFSDGSVVSINISSQSIDEEKINDDELMIDDFVLEFIDSYSLIIAGNIHTSHIQDGAVQLEDIEVGGLTYDHLAFNAAFEFGGTNQTVYGDVGDLLVVSNNQFISEDKIVLSNQKFGINQDTPVYHLDIMMQDQAEYPLKIVSETNTETSIVLRNDLGIWSFNVNNQGSFILENQLNTNFNFLEINSNGFLGVLTAPSIEKLTLAGALHVGDSIVADGELLPGTIYFSDATKSFKFITELGAQSLLAFQDNSIEMPSFLYTNNIENYSENSRVSLGDSSVLVGENHLLNGAFNSYVDGNQQMIEHSVDSQIVGSNSIVKFVDNSQVFGDELLVNQLLNSTILSQSSHIYHVDHSIIIGDLHKITMADQLRVDGTNQSIDFARRSIIEGQNIQANHINDSIIQGDAHSIKFLDHVEILGSNNDVSYGGRVQLDGENNSLMHIYDSLVVGHHNLLMNARNAIVEGDMNQILLGDGYYTGSFIRHYGSGRPIVDAHRSMILGSQDNRVLGNDSIVLGSSDFADEFDIDDSITILAYGGVDIIHNDVTVAYLGDGAGSWSHLSDKGLKVNIRPIDSISILDKMISLPVSEWRYKGQDYVQHIGPMAQDFYDLFKLGNDDKFINSVDIDGIIFASIQGLGHRLDSIYEKKTLLAKSSNQFANEIKDIQLKKERFIVSANVLKNQESQISDRYRKIHEKEIKQRLSIEKLNDRIVRIKSLMEDSK